MGGGDYNINNMKLTLENYFTPENKYLSNSKISDWLRCKNYFYKKHVTHEIVEGKTDAMLVGSATDNILTDIHNVSDGKYVVRQFNGTTKDGKAETELFKELGKVILTQAKYDEIMGMSIAVSETSAYKELKNHKAQEILQIDMPIGKHFIGLCGVPDWYIINSDGVCIITDLKTAKTIDEKRYFYHCKEFGYFKQQADYQMILASLHPEIKTFLSRHLVVHKDKNVWTVKAFILSQSEIEKEKAELLKIINDISNEVEFKKTDATWENAITISDPNSRWFEQDEE